MPHPIQLQLVAAAEAKKTGPPLATAKWQDTIDKEGWAKLDVATTPKD